jgi:flagellar biosynthetic protein FlhB
MFRELLFMELRRLIAENWPRLQKRPDSGFEARPVMFMDLQWFAAEDEGRTEEPSEYKIRKAREEGRVAKSQELVGALVLLLPALTILVLAPYILRTCLEMLQFYFSRAVELDPVKDRVIAVVFFS